MVEEAETLLCEADSLRVKGIAPTDSALWAETVAALYPWRLFYPTDYAKANYYYGRLLREKGYHSDAMECFIDASHAHTKDHMLLGRVYSNIGELCRLEGHYDLACEMQSCAANQFKQGNNFTAYYFELNNMAVVRAYQKDINVAKKILSIIEQQCTDFDVLTKILETKAIVHLQQTTYDSTIFYIDVLQARGNHEPTGYVMKAQAYNRWGYKDTALMFARKALACPCSLNDSVNMLYITSHNDTSLNEDSILIITSERADKQFEYTRQQEKLSHAVEILQQSMKPNYKWLYGVVVTLLIVGIVIGIILFATHKRRTLKIQQIETLISDGKNEYLALLDRNIGLRDENETYYQTKYRQLLEECNCICNMPEKELRARTAWRDFDKLVEYTNTHMYGFVDKLYQKCPSLSEKEVRMCILSLIGVSGPKAAELVPYAATGIRKFKSTTLQKIGFSGLNVREKLLDFACK